MNNRGLVVLGLSLLALGLALHTARSQEHHHPPQDVQLHEQFYRTWMMPDRPSVSCCNLSDCYPTKATFNQVDQHWYAERREDGKMLRIPHGKVEQNRDNPDGRPHLCAPPPGTVGVEVYCFTVGGGI